MTICFYKLVYIEWPNSTKNIAMQISNYRNQDTVYIFSCLRVLHPLVSFWISLRLKNSNCHVLWFWCHRAPFWFSLSLYVIVAMHVNTYPQKLLKKNKTKQQQKTIVQSTPRGSLPLEKNMIIANTNIYICTIGSYLFLAGASPHVQSENGLRFDEQIYYTLILRHYSQYATAT